MKIRYLLFLLLLFTGGSALAQEMLMELGSNPVLIERAKRAKQQESNAKYSVLPQATVLTLPFIEDFSKEDVYPDSSKWIDKKVFINRTFPKAPPTIGVATFDGLAETGLAYNINASSGSSGYADTLTSKEIDLTAPADSVYFSFYYQAQGRGNAPETQDSLILQFKEQNDTVWTRVWARAGYQLGTDSLFNYVQIYVPSQYYYGNFQFRFLNRATLSGNVDHWHIDLVYLNDERNLNEAPLYDIAFVYPPPRLLKNYSAIPYRQFTPGEMDTTYWNPIRNNSNIQFPAVKYTLTVRNEAGVPTVASLDNRNIEPFDPNGYTICISPNSCPGLLFDTISYTYPVPPDSTHFTVTQVMQVNDSINGNDSINTTVNFHNYYAYDDGTAEQAWGVYGAFAMVAYKFTLNTPDTLRAVSIFWNPYVANVEPHGVRISVWGDANGSPGQILYQTEVEYPVYQDGYNGFQYFMLDDTILNMSGTFYIGYMQIDPETLSVGMDMNTNVQSKIFYNTTGSWSNTNYKGALMMRPHFGESFLLVGVNEVKPRETTFTVYPNPANDRLYISGRDAGAVSRVSIFDTFGRSVMAEQLMTGEHSMNVSQLPAGVYFIRIETAGSVSAHRIVIAR